MSGINIPADSTHLSDQDRADMIEQYGGTVDSQFAKRSMMRRFINTRTVRGTDTLIDRRVGRTSLVTLTPGVRPPATPTPFGKVSVTVDTVVLARDNRSMLNEFQIDFNARRELGMDHGKELGKFFDEAMLIAGIKAAAKTEADSLNGAFGDGTTATLAASGDDEDPDKLYEAIATGITELEEKEVDVEECAIFVRPTSYDVLLNNDKLVNQEFSGDNGNFAKGMFKVIKGVPIVSTPRLPRAAIASHPLSNAGNSNFYNISATEALTRALIMHPKSILAGETIPLTSDVYFDKVEKQWFIDSWLAFGASANRGDATYAVRAFD
jgi:hypothetical protein